MDWETEKAYLDGYQPPVPSSSVTPSELSLDDLAKQVVLLAYAKGVKDTQAMKAPSETIEYVERALADLKVAFNAADESEFNFALQRLSELGAGEQYIGIVYDQLGYDPDYERFWVFINDMKTERLRQIDKFQVQEMTPKNWMLVLMEEVGEVAKALAEGDADNYRAELVQVATVCLAAAQNYDMWVKRGV